MPCLYANKSDPMRSWWGGEIDGKVIQWYHCVSNSNAQMEGFYSVQTLGTQMITKNDVSQEKSRGCEHRQQVGGIMWCCARRNV